jgi:hypothetical protein
MAGRQNATTERLIYDTPDLCKTGPRFREPYDLLLDADLDGARTRRCYRCRQWYDRTGPLNLAKRRSFPVLG